jgi:cytochrome b subunit of formate dehydrogenase/mono/diheme cytochrome c family protein
MKENTDKITRFSVFQRIEHWVLFASFTTLALTGLPQKYPLAGISDSIIRFLGGIEIVRTIHHVAAIIFIMESVYHLVVVGYKLYVMRLKASMMPGVSTVTEGIQSLLYNLGIRRDMPKAGRFNFAEKIEYWAMIWGLVLMGLTGFMLWNPIAVTNVLPGDFIPAAKSAHGNEAVLAVLAILVWHVYSVHLRHWNWSIFTGKLTRKEMEEEHPLELEDIESGKAAMRPAPAVQQRRKIVYIPVAAVVSAGLLFGIYRFATFEQTALTTVPPPISTNFPVFEKQTATPLPTQAPTPTAAPTATQVPGATSQPLTWDTGIGDLFKTNCTACHGSMGGLSLATYADAMKGGTNGAVIISGNPDGSLLVQKMQGTHPKVLSPADLAKVIAWIQAGAPEK